MARKTGQIIRRGAATWLVRIYVGRDQETGKRGYIGKAIHGGLRAAQAHLNKMLAERDLGRNIRSSRQTLWAVSRSLARHLCPAAAQGEELSRLLKSPCPLHPSATGLAATRRAFGGRDPDAL
jgi:hypothetical protein